MQNRLLLYSKTLYVHENMFVRCSLQRNIVKDQREMSILCNQNTIFEIRNVPRSLKGEITDKLRCQNRRKKFKYQRSMSHDRY